MSDLDLRAKILATIDGADIPPDGMKVKGHRAYVTGTGQVVVDIHKKTDCTGKPCVIHRPSKHSMRAFPTHFRYDRYLMERICPHGVGHPDPDDVAWQQEVMPQRAPGIHGCDGCCMSDEDLARHGLGRPE